MPDKVVLIYDNSTEEIVWLKEKEPIVTTTQLSEAVRYPENEVDQLVSDLQDIMGPTVTVYSGNPTTPPPPPF